MDYSVPERELLERIASGVLTAEEAFAELTTAKPRPSAPARAVVAKPDPRDIAIVGVSVRLPGADSLADLWALLSAGKSAITEIPRDRWELDGFYDGDHRVKNRSVSRWGGFLRGADEFDAQFFNISPKEAELMDPQQRLFLQEAWRAFEDAGISDERLSGSKCGVYAGFGGSVYEALLQERKVEAELYVMSGNAGAILPARVSYFMNLRGPCVTVDTACSSSLVALHLACESLRSGESQIALAGGATIFPHPKFYLLASKAGMLAADGQCKTFDQSADGFVPGEGVGAVVVKRLTDALADGDHIYGVIKGSGVNQDGRTNGITAPSGIAQAELECGVYDRFGIDPGTIGYVEAHGTGTKLGDPIEVDALISAFSRYTKKTEFCAIGSVKTNLGHTQASAGVAGLAKVLLCLKYGQLVPTLNVKKVNPLIRFEGTPFYVNTALTEWKPGGDRPRRAALSAFGFSGTNAHVVVEEYVGGTTASATQPFYPIWVSARDRRALRRRIAELGAFLAANDVSLADVAHTLLKGRSHLAARVALVVRSKDELQAARSEIDVDRSSNVRVIDKRTTKGIDAERIRDDRDGAARGPIATSRSACRAE